jgi:Tfp pilus assembly protein PilV
MGSKKNQNGFTLIEAAVAIVILIVGLFSVIAFFPLSLKMTGNSQNLTTATNLALAKTEELKALTYENLGTGVIETKHRLSSDPNNYQYNYQRQTIVETVDSNLNPSGTDIGLKKATITVYWLSPIGNQEKATSFTSLFSQY